jgi:hypothetical protein
MFNANVMLALFAVACSQTPDPAAPTDDVTGRQLQGNGQGPDVNPDAPVLPDSPDCKFRTADACFSNAAAACKAAGCDEASCEQKETSPVQISCGPGNRKQE